MTAGTDRGRQRPGRPVPSVPGSRPWCWGAATSWPVASWLAWTLLEHSKRGNRLEMGKAERQSSFLPWSDSTWRVRTNAPCPASALVTWRKSAFALQEQQLLAEAISKVTSRVSRSHARSPLETGAEDGPAVGRWEQRGRFPRQVPRRGPRGPARPAVGPAAAAPDHQEDPPAPVPEPRPRSARPEPHSPAAAPSTRAELVEALNGRGRGPRAGSPTLPGRGAADSSSGSSGEDEDFKGCPQGPRRPESLAFLAACPRRGADCASESVWSSDSLDESKSSSSEVTSPDTCDLSSGDGASVRSSSKDARPTVPPLTVRLHTQSVSKCVTEDGRTVAVGDIVWGKIHGFPWWPARVLDISLSQKEDGEPSWQEAKVSWFGSPTTSFLSTSKLSPFSEFFKLRFNRKKKGMYRKAITEAANAAQHVAPEIRELLTEFET